MEREKIVCWSCWKSLEACTCGPDQVPMTLKKPTTVLPTYARPPIETLPESIDLEMSVLRVCCACGKAWPCKIKDWMKAVCPNCGAK